MFIQHPDVRIREAFEAVVKRLEALEAHAASHQPDAAVQVPEPVPPAPEAAQELTAAVQPPAIANA